MMTKIFDGIWRHRVKIYHMYITGKYFKYPTIQCVSFVLVDFMLSFACLTRAKWHIYVCVVFETVIV